jgi:hypothetical protein
MPHNEEKQTLSRRDALKTLAAITGAVTLASLPSKWQTPVVQVGALPAHAQCSVVPGTVTFYIINNSSQPYMVSFVGSGYSNSVTVSANGGTGCLVGVPVGVELTGTETFCGETFSGWPFFVPEELAGQLEEVEVPAGICEDFNGVGGLGGSLFSR